METNKKFKYLGYGDTCSSLVKIGATMATTGVPMYYILNEEKYSGFFSTYLFPSLSLLGTIAMVTISVSQIKSATKLVRAAKESLGRVEMERARENWKFRNLVTSIASCIWLTFFGITSLVLYGWYIAVILGLFMMAGVGRGLVYWGIINIEYLEEMDMAPYPPDMVEEFMNVQGQRHRQQMAAIGEAVGSGED